MQNIIEIVKEKMKQDNNGTLIKEVFKLKKDRDEVYDNFFPTEVKKELDDLMLISSKQPIFSNEVYQAELKVAKMLEKYDLLSDKEYIKITENIVKNEKKVFENIGDIDTSITLEVKTIEEIMKELNEEEIHLFSLILLHQFKKEDEGNVEELWISATQNQKINESIFDGDFFFNKMEERFLRKDL